MVKKWIKFLRKQPKYISIEIREVIQKILRSDIEKLDIKKLRGYENRYRCRIGKIRIIYEKTYGGVEIIEIKYRGDIY